MTGDTAEVRIIEYHAWYDWIKFYDSIGNHIPEEKIYLGWYLGPDIYVGPSLT